MFLLNNIMDIYNSIVDTSNCAIFMHICNGLYVTCVWESHVITNVT